MSRESLGSRLGFIMLSVGCAVGLGNVWRFPFVVGKHGGGMFVLLYLVFLALMGFPILTMELGVGRMGGANLIGSFRNLTGNRRRWVWPAKLVFIGNFILMIYYTTVSGWLLAYAKRYIDGSMMSIDARSVGAAFDQLTGTPSVSGGYMLLTVFLATAVCACGLRNGVEKVVKYMMGALFVLIAILAGYALTTKGSAPGVSFYLKPDWNNFISAPGETVFAAMGQAFFTLSIGVGSMAIFGSYIGKERRLAGESVIIIALDTLIAFMAGMIIFPICFSYGVEVNAGPGLIFVSLPNIFNNMTGGRFWGALFFIFLSLAALTTVIAVVENLIAFFIDEMKLSRKVAALITGTGVAICSLPCVFGFNIWKDVQPLGGGSSILDFEDFIVSQNLLPIGSMLIVLYCALNWNAFMEEVNTGKGMIFPAWMKNYCRYILPLIVVVIFVWGYRKMFS